MKVLNSEPTRITKWLSDPRTPQVLSVAAIVILAAAPVIFFIRNLIFFPCHARDFYPYFHQFACGLTGLALFCFLYQCLTQKRSLPRILRGCPPMLWFIAFAVLMILSSIVNGLNNYALYGYNVNETFFLSLAFFLLYVPAGMLIHRPADKRLILRVLVFAAAFTGVTELIHIYIVPLEVYKAYTAYRLEPTLMFPNTNFYGYLLSIMIPGCAGMAAAEEKIGWKLFAALTFLANCVVLILNGTLGAVLAVGVALVFQIIVLLLTERRLSWITLALLVCYIGLYIGLGAYYAAVFRDIRITANDLANPADEYNSDLYSTNIRILLWKKSLHLIAEKPLLGWGDEGTFDILAKNLGEGRAHNEYLQYTMYYGIPAGICYIAGCFSVYLRGLKNRRRLDRYSVAALTAAFGYLTSAFVGNTKMLTTGLFLALLGLGFSIPAGEPEKSPET